MAEKTSSWADAVKRVAAEHAEARDGRADQRAAGADMNQLRGESTEQTYEKNIRSICDKAGVPAMADEVIRASAAGATLRAAIETAAPAQHGNDICAAVRAHSGLAAQLKKGAGSDTRAADSIAKPTAGAWDRAVAKVSAEIPAQAPTLESES